jgi:hypothetical protein
VYAFKILAIAISCGVARQLVTHSGSCNLLYALFIFKQVRRTCCLSFSVYFHCVIVTFFWFLSLAILDRLSQLSPLVDWHKLTYLVLTCRKTPINQLFTDSYSREVLFLCDRPTIGIVTTCLLSYAKISLMYVLWLQGVVVLFRYVLFGLALILVVNDKTHKWC